MLVAMTGDDFRRQPELMAVAPTFTGCATFEVTWVLMGLKGTLKVLLLRSKGTLPLPRSQSHKKHKQSQQKESITPLPLAKPNPDAFNISVSNSTWLVLPAPDNSERNVAEVSFYPLMLRCQIGRPIGPKNSEAVDSCASIWHTRSSKL